jgi:hypothetical protein
MPALIKRSMRTLARSEAGAGCQSIATGAKFQFLELILAEFNGRTSSLRSVRKESVARQRSESLGKVLEVRSMSGGLMLG